MMVVLVILAMLAFTLGDLFTTQGTNLWLLGLLLGGVVFGVAGISSGRWLHWGIGGAVVGAILGLVMPDFTQPAGVIATSFGIIEQEELQDLSERRGVANGFMMLATEEAYGPGARQFAFQFQFGHSTVREDLLFGRLMSEEARALGITVTNDMVETFINKQTDDRLSRESFAKARSALLYQNKPVLDETLFDILREQIRTRLAHLALAPRESVAPPSPELFWGYFQRFNVRQSINVAELDVDAFLDQVEVPPDAKFDDLIVKMFEAAKTKPPNQDAPGSPGFILPGRARIAWLEQDYDSMESTVPPVTDEEIQAYYDENRDVEYRTIVIPDKLVPAAEESSATDATPTENTDGDQDAAGVTPNAEADAPEVDKSTGESTDDTAGDEADSANPSGAGTGSDENEKDDEPADEETSTETNETNETNGQFSIDDPEAAADADADEQATTADEPSAQADAATADEGTESPVDSPFPSQLKLPMEPDPGSDDVGLTIEREYEYRELDDELRNQIREQLLQQRVSDAIEKKMVSGWEFLRSLQTELSTRRAEFMKEDSQKYLDDPDAAAIELRQAMAEFTPVLLERMKKYADENGFTYAVTPQLVSYQDFNDEDNYPLGVAVEPNRQRFQTAGAADTVAYKLFSGFSMDPAANDTQLFIPERAVYEPASDLGTQSHYTYWSVEFVEPHVPDLKEPGVREQVVLALKRGGTFDNLDVTKDSKIVGARDILLERANELAQKVRDGLAKTGEERTTMAATLETESITGEEGSATLFVRSSLPFAWLRQSQTPQTSFQPRRPRAELSAIRFADGVSTLTGVGQPFMKTIFKEMDDEEVGTVWNYDRTRCFLVHVTNRFPTEDRGIDGLRDRFAAEGKMNFMTSPVPGLMGGEIVSPVIAEWERSIWRKYGVDPDEEPGQS